MRIQQDSDSTLNFSGTQAAGAGVNPLGRAVDDRLDATYVHLPCSAGTSVRVGNLRAESNFLAANIAFCHLSAPPSGLLPKQQIYVIRFEVQLQAFFEKDRINSGKTKYPFLKLYLDFRAALRYNIKVSLIWTFSSAG
jgi:hypothetical protein